MNQNRLFTACIFFEQLKQGECMRAINSSDKNIILIFVLLSIISAR